MPRCARALSASGVYHVMSRGVNRMQIFHDDADSVYYLTQLDAVQTEDCQVLAYCLMGNHFHLLLKTGKTSLDAMEYMMKKLGIRYAGYYNEKYERIGPVFQGRYVSQPVTTVTYFLRVLRYIHANPVVADIVKTMGEYPWSSYRDYFGNRPKPLCVVHLDYALQLRDINWLQHWHELPDHNPEGIADIDAHARSSDAKLAALMQQHYHCSPPQVAALTVDRRTQLLRTLCLEENAPIPQVSRLTGIPRGEIKRCLLKS